MAVSIGRSAFQVCRNISLFSKSSRNVLSPILACDCKRIQTVRKTPWLIQSDRSLSTPVNPGIPDLDIEDIERRLTIPDEKIDAVVNKVNKDIVTNPSRIFAVVYFKRKQYKVTVEDLILSIDHIEADIGQKIRLEKIMMVGGNDFSLIGRPLLARDLVEVWATVIEKTTTPNQIFFVKKRRKGFKRWIDYKDDLTVLRINSIEITPLK